MDYRQAGVDVEAGRAFVNKIRGMVDSTQRPEVLGGFGGFSGCMEIPAGYRHPVLVSGTDGVGTKLKLAHTLDIHHTVGIDLVAMCVNDVLTSGAEPLFFLDYLATGKLEPQQLAAVVEGVVEGCKQAGCTLLGGETAEMPGFYQPGEYDLAGFCVGVAEKANLLNGTQVQVGDRVLGLASSGIHSNGFSLVRKIVEPHGWQARPEGLGGRSLAEVCLTPTSIYVSLIQAALKAGVEIRAMAHITGGGLPENLPRCLGAGQAVRVEPGTWPVLPIFDWLAIAGEVTPRDMYHTFNMGIGYAVLVAPDQEPMALAHFQQQGVAAYPIGSVIAASSATPEKTLVGLPE